MKTVTQTFVLCRNRERPGARCRRLPRCKTCGRALTFDWHTGLCFDCEQKAKAEAQEKADPSTRRCEVCGAILTSVFADSVCVKCAGVRNVKGGGK